MLCDNSTPGEATQRLKPSEPPRKLFSRDFILLFCMAMCSNIGIAVFYCFEQWLEAVHISPNWRGALISALFAMILIFRPLASFLLFGRGKLWTLAVSITVSSLVMLGYLFTSPTHPIEFILALRLIQGIALAFYSSCVVAVLVSCIPKGQSAHGFALFSLTSLLPYAVVPALSEYILPLLGNEPRLFAATAALGLPALLMLIPLSPRLKASDPTPQQNENSLSGRALRHAVSHSGLLFVYLACLIFGIVTMMVISFIKGLCTLNGLPPALFFSTYTLVMIVVRVLGGRRLNTLPRYQATSICCVVLALALLGLAWGPGWAFVAFTALYGLGLSVLYPLLAAVIYDRSAPGTHSINSNVMMSTFDASGIFGPMFGGLVIQAGFGYRGVFVAAGLSILLCSLCMLVDKMRWRASRARTTPNQA